jgi:nitrogen fixation protein NifZ
MTVEDLDIGDVVYAANTIKDDGSIPDGKEGEILAEVGTRGVITMIGHVEDEPTRTVWLVRFEDKDRNLGNPIGCWVEDLVVEAKRNELIKTHCN